MSFKETFTINVPEKILIGDIVSINKDNSLTSKYHININIDNDGWIGECVCLESEFDFNLKPNEVLSHYYIKLMFAKDIFVEIIIKALGIK